MATSGSHPQAWTDHVTRLDGLCECWATPQDDAPASPWVGPAIADFASLIRASCYFAHPGYMLRSGQMNA